MFTSTENVFVGISFADLRFLATIERQNFIARINLIFCTFGNQYNSTTKKQ